MSCSVRRARTGATLVKSVDVNRCKPGRKLSDLVRYGALRAFLGAGGDRGLQVVGAWVDDRQHAGSLVDDMDGVEGGCRVEGVRAVGTDGDGGDGRTDAGVDDA
ncbi:MAG: hypothetical protein JWO13_4097 [Acidobacteriales bacterium]|nr:hypothetical protein [Terriglobales bacterium]